MLFEQREVIRERDEVLNGPRSSYVMTRILTTTGNKKKRADCLTPVG
jgi:hypothetical protein